MTSQRHKSVHRHKPELPEAVLDATRAEVLAVGVRRATLTDVARRAGVSRMTLYRLVPDVTTLILDVISREFTALLVDAERVAHRRRTARARIVATAVEVARRLPDEPLLRRVLDVDPQLLVPYLTDRLGHTQLAAIDYVSRALADGFADGSVRKGDPKVIATTLVVAITPFVVSVKLFDPLGRERVLRELERLLDGWLRP
jgi:AcrR family transcriptional regulator